MSKLKISDNINGENSSESKFIKELNVAFATNDVEFITEHMTEDIIWDMVGDKLLSGKPAVASALKEMAFNKVDTLTLNHIISHSSKGSSQGEIGMNGSTYSFCDIYEFTNEGKIMLRKMISYVIKLS